MNKKRLIRAISQEIEQSISQNYIMLVLNKAIEIANRTLESGESVKWTGFGSLVVKEVPPRRFYSPKLKKYINSKGRRKIIFVKSQKGENYK